jgi:APA family basic amino acid/polyamine antiporter
VVRVAVVFSVVLYVASYTALFVLRRREPLTPRPYRAWGYPWLPILGLLIAAGLLVSIVLADYFAALVTGALLLLSWPASGVVRRALR